MCGVQRFSKAILITLAVVVVLAVVAVFGLNLYVQTPGAQARIQQELSRALRMPLQITNTSISPWGGLRISGVSVPAAGGGNFLEVASFSARYAVLPLLRGRVHISDMVLTSPRVVWAQNEEGKWVLPGIPKKTGEATGIEPDEPRPERKKKRAGDEGTVLLDGLEIRDGTIELLDAKGARVALATEVEVHYTALSDRLIEGTFRIGTLSHASGLNLLAVQTPFKSSEGVLTLADLQASLAGGTARATFELENGKKEMPFRSTLKWDAVDLARLTTDLGQAPGDASGSLRGTLELAGSSREMERAVGKGNLILTGGQFRQLDLLQTIGQVLSMSELSNLRLDEARADFRVADEKIFLEPLVLQAPQLQVSATGEIRFDRALKLQAVLSVDEKLLRTPIIKDRFQDAGEPGRRALTFRIYNTVDRPKTDLVDQLIGQTIGGNFTDAFISLFGGKKKPEDEKKEEEKKRRDKEKKDKKREAEKPAIQ